MAQSTPQLTDDVAQHARKSLAQRYRTVRAASEALAEPLAPEDQVIQSMPDASPTKWHLAHTTWFFEHFILAAQVPDYRPFHPGFGYLFNSYYNTVGEMHRRPQRGLLSRPTVAEVGAYRASVDDAMQELLLARGEEPEIVTLVTLGLNHEQQHQELIVTDIKHALAQNPLKPVYRERAAPEPGTRIPLEFHTQPEGLCDIGFAGDDFAFDNETPRHRTLIRPHALANRPITNGEYRDFIRAGGYTDANLWLSDGWSTLQEHNWRRPLYWDESLDTEFTLAGTQPIAADAPVCHLSLYEADAFARWAGARLPSEAEWECAAADLAVSGRFLESGALHPRAAPDTKHMTQLFGDVWEWTSSAYAPYPGFKPLSGSLGEYNGKFMCNQTVLRGGSCASPASHLRATYRNFFYPHMRWQFTGLRLASDL